MPLRTYECVECGKHEDVLQGMREQIFTEMKFEACSKQSCACKNRLDVGASIRFVGSGFYVNDYK